MAQTNGKTLIAVTTATGNIGHVVAEQLLKKGLRVRAIGRTAGKLEALKAQGAEIFEGSMDDAASMAQAFQGASGAFLLIPPNMQAPDVRAYQNKVGETLANAAVKAGIRHIVNLSSVGAHLEKGTGPIVGLHDQEERLNALSIPVVHLRPAYFMENHLHAIGIIKAKGIYGNPLSGDHAFSQIATHDIGLFAAEQLAAGPKNQGKTVLGLFGPRDYSMVESAKILGTAIGKPDLKYTQFPYEDGRKGMISMGLSVSMANAYIEMLRAFNEGKVLSTEKREPANTGKTTLEQFARTIFKNAYGSQPAAAAAH
jgi:uncharacterized protein YbjT (DUF2867 family)